MAAVEEGEIRPGLVVYVGDTQQLRAIGGSETNAKLAGTEDRAAQGPHQFLVLSVDRTHGSCLAVPLFSEWASGNLPLDRAKMGGNLPVWRNGTYHFSRWQHWRIPLAALAAASSGELSDPADRCTYAEADTAELASIAAWQHKNRADFRPLS